MSLTMYFMEVGGSDTGMKILAEKMEGHLSLMEFRLENYQPSEEVLHSNSFDSVISSVIMLPTMEKVGRFARAFRAG